MKIGVIGSGYVGLVAAACFAEMGNDVICIDIDEKKINSLKNGKVPIYEPGLDSLVINNFKKERLIFSTNICDALNNAEVVFLIDGKKIKCNGIGNGPVNALDNAIRENFSKVEKYYNFFSDLKLLDYKVRILNTGTEAITRVLIESTDKTGVSWFTIGVSPNIIEASFKALIDSLDYKLFKENAPGNLKLNAK